MRKQTIYKKLKTTKHHHQITEGRNGQTFVHREAFDERIVFAVELDWDELNALARKAAGNKSRKARDGALTVEIIKKEKLP